MSLTITIYFDYKIIFNFVLHRFFPDRKLSIVRIFTILLYIVIRNLQIISLKWFYLKLHKTNAKDENNTKSKYNYTL